MTKKDEEAEEPTEAWRVETVFKGKASAKDFIRFGNEIESVLNELEYMGYGIHGLWHEPRGQVIIARKRETLARQFGMPSALGPPPGMVKVKFDGANSHRLFELALQNIDVNASDDEQTEVAKLVVNDVMGSASAEEIRRTIKDCFELMKRHEEVEHEGEHPRAECHFTKAIGRVQVALEIKLRLQLQ